MRVIEGIYVLLKMEYTNDGVQGNKGGGKDDRMKENYAYLSGREHAGAPGRGRVARNDQGLGEQGQGKYLVDAQAVRARIRTGGRCSAKTGGRTGTLVINSRSRCGWQVQGRRGGGPSWKLTGAHVEMVGDDVGVE